jgi:hypothetical protein
MNYSTARLRIAAAAAALAVLGILTQVLTEPAGGESSTARALAAAGAHQGAWFAADWAEILGYTAAALAVATVTGLVRGRGGWLTATGGWLTTASFLVLGLNALSLAEGVLAAQPDRAAMVRAEDAISASGALTPLLLLAFGSLLGPVLLAFGLWRSGRIGWWLPALSVAGAVLFVVSGAAEGSRVAALAGQLPLCAQLAVLGWLCLRAGDRGRDDVALAPAEPAAV